MTERSSTFLLADALHVRDATERLIDMRIAPWDTVAETESGLELIERGAFADTDPASVVLRMEHENPAAGRGVSLEERDDGAYMTMRVARTPRGDELLASAIEGLTPGASVGFHWVKGGHRTIQRAGRRVTAHRRVELREVSTTWRPAYSDAALLAVRSDEGRTDVTESTMEAVEAPEPAVVAATETPAAVTELSERYLALTDRLERLEERSRQEVTADALVSGPLSTTVERRVLAERALADVLTTDNEGVVPDAFVSEMIGIIDASRPFLATTRRLPTPSAGTRLIVPVIQQRPLVGKQATEKAEVASRKTIIDTTDFSMETYAGAGDLSIQLIRRSSPEFLNLWLELLGEAYADETEDAAVDALLAAAGINAGAATFNPLEGDVSFGEAFRNAQAVSKRLFPDTVWLSTDAMGDIIDAKTDGTNLPLYGDVSLSLEATGRLSGTWKGLRPVHVPALDDEAVDAIVGPSRGFAWAEDGTYTLQADVPSKAGRDVGIVGMVWFAPWYPEAFTTYSKTS